MDELLKYFYSQHDKFSIRISWHQQHLIENCLDIQSFIDSISTSLEKNNLDISEHSYPLGYFQVEQPSRINYVHVIFLFTALERRMMSLIKMLKELKPCITVKLSDYKGPFLDKVKQFLKEQFLVDLTLNQSWQNIITYQKIRDCVIHCGGNSNESRDKDYFVKLFNKQTIQINENGYIKLTVEFCKGMESAVLDLLLNGLDELYIKLAEAKD